MDKSNKRNFPTTPVGKCKSTKLAVTAWEGLGGFVCKMELWETQFPLEIIYIQSIIDN